MLRVLVVCVLGGSFFASCVGPTRPLIADPDLRPARLAPVPAPAPSLVRTAPAPAPSVSTTALTAEERRRNNFILLRFGSAQLEEEAFFGEVDQPTSIGIESARRFGRLPLGFDAGFRFSADYDEEDTTDTDDLSAFLEGSLGLRGMVDVGPVHFYGGAGVSLLWGARYTEVDGDEVFEEDDTTVGVFAKAGILFRFAPVFLVGIEGRVLRGAELELGAVDVDADYDELAFVLAWSF